MITEEKYAHRRFFFRDHAERRGCSPMAGRDPPYRRACGAAASEISRRTTELKR
jgi:hypothetical protein